MMGMRLVEGLDMGRYRNISGKDLPADRITHLVDIGMVETHGDRLIATDDGRAVLNAILRELLVE
jgi:oxygen-independent coproporphyrinogen-3 oxidase